MDKRLLTLIITALCVLLGTNSFAQSTPNKEIEEVLNIQNVHDSKVGIYAVDLDSGKVVYAFNEAELFNPASNTKLITGAAALELLGPNFSLTTRVSADKVTAGVVDGPLYLKSDGDPYLLWDDFVRMAVELRRSGITKVTDGVVVDDTAFDPGFMPPGFDQKNEDASYRAPIGAVSVNFNSVRVTVSPADTLGGPAKVEIFPPNQHVALVNKAKTVKGRKRRVGVKSVTTKEGTQIEVRGVIGSDAGDSVTRKRIDNPSLFAASVFAEALTSVGITVEGETRRGVRPESARSLVVQESKPLVWHVMLMNKWSNNFMAEQIFRLLGDDGTTSTIAKSYETVDSFLSAAGVAGTYKMHNGSGLYDGNLFSPKQIVDVLQFMAKHKYGPEFAVSLAIGGEDGTLSRRFKGGGDSQIVRGKTGTLNEVTALSGYMTTRTGRRIAYSVLFNNTPVKAWTLRDQQDRIARALWEL